MHFLFFHTLFLKQTDTLFPLFVLLFNISLFRHGKPG